VASRHEAVIGIVTSGTDVVLAAGKFEKGDVLLVVVATNTTLAGRHFVDRAEV
jgi:hypothetical protein